MKIENITIVHLDRTDVSRASINGGLSVSLPPQTTEVVIRTRPEAPNPSPALVASSETAPIESGGDPR